MRGIRYSELIYGLQRAQVQLDRKVLSDIAVHDPDAFTAIADLAKANLPKAGVSA
jgi:large subunit ribosomal protein L20